jgi:hypothetical protein
VRAAKPIALVLLGYAGIVIAFESLIGFFQPADETTLVISTTAEDGTWNDRVLSRLDSNGQVYVAANHWPRAWYNRALEDSNVQVSLDGEKADYLAVPVSAEEHDRVDRENSLGILLRILTGFPPRVFLRLDPR